jgi:hypothetical protein
MKASGSPHLSRSVGHAFSQLSANPKSAATAARAARSASGNGSAGAQLAIDGYRQEIHISGRTLDEAAGGQRGTSYDHDLNLTAERLQLIGQRAEQQIDRLVSDLHTLECSTTRC